MVEFITLFILPLIPLFFTGPVAASIFIVLLKRDSRRIQPFFWLALIAATIALGIFTAYTFSNFFPGPGCFITLFTLPSAIVTLLTFRLQAKRFYQAIVATSSGDGAGFRPPRWLSPCCS